MKSINVNFTEILTINSISIISLLSYNTLKKNNVFLEYIYWIIPQYLIIMYPSEKQNLLVLLFNLIDFNKIRYKKVNFKNISHCNRNVVTFIRSIVALQTAICILGADFKSVFPEKFLKQKSYGLSLMDIGVGSYLFNGGIFAHKCKWKNIIYLFLLGIIRLLFIKIFNLQVDVYEYGEHSNFYFILGSVHLLYKLIPKHNFYYKYIGYVILFIFTVLTKFFHINEFILNDNRNSFLQKNKESFYVLIPFVSFFMIIQHLSDKIFNNKFKMYNLLKYSLLFYCLLLISLQIELPSRRLGNLSYLFYILFSHTLIMVGYYFVGVLTEFKTYKIIEYVSANMMKNFLITNIIVLVLKKCISFNKKQCDTVMLIYLFVSFVIPIILLKKFNLKKCIKILM